MTRANNIAIMLTRFAAFSGPDELLAEVCSLSSGVTADHLMLLMQVVPGRLPIRSVRTILHVDRLASLSEQCLCRNLGNVTATNLYVRKALNTRLATAPGTG